MNEIDIMYYDSMIDMVSENRKIMEFSIGTSLELMSLQESTRLVIYESKIIETISNSIKEIFKKVIEFATNVMKKITGDGTFTPDEKLIKACNEKYNSMDEDTLDDFYVENISMRGACIQSLDWGNDRLNEMHEMLNKTVDEYNKFIEGTNTSDPSFNENKVDECMSEINKREQSIKNKENAKAIDSLTVKLCLDPTRATYANSKNTLNKANKQYKEIQQKMKEAQRKADKNARSNKNKDFNAATLGSYRNAVHSITSCVMRLFKFLINVSILQFKNEEAILRKFMAYSSSNA